MSAITIPAETAELIRGYEHLYDGELAEAERLGQDTPDVIRAYRQIVTNAQLVAYLRATHPEAVWEAERAVEEVLK